MDLWRWAPVPSDLPISAGSSTSVNVLNDRQQLAVTLQMHCNELMGLENTSTGSFVLLFVLASAAFANSVKSERLLFNY